MGGSAPHSNRQIRANHAVTDSMNLEPGDLTLEVHGWSPGPRPMKNDEPERACLKFYIKKYIYTSQLQKTIGSQEAMFETPHAQMLYPFTWDMFVSPPTPP